jgi:hypothetical protein
MEIQRVQEFVPSGLRHLQQEPHLKHVLGGGDLTERKYSFAISEGHVPADRDPETLPDEELFVLDSSVIWSIENTVQKSFTLSPEHAEDIRGTVWTFMDFEDDEPGVIVTHRTLVILYSSFAKFFLENGSTYTAKIPFLTSQVWALERGLLISRELESGETVDKTGVSHLFTWAHPLKEIKWLPLLVPPSKDLHTSKNRELKSSKKGDDERPTAVMPIDERVLCVQKTSNRSRKTMVVTLSDTTGRMSLWECEVLGSSGKKLERTYSAYRQSPLNLRGETDLFRLLGDNKSEMGLKKICSCFLDDR